MAVKEEKYCEYCGSKLEETEETYGYDTMESRE